MSKKSELKYIKVSVKLLFINNIAFKAGNDAGRTMNSTAWDNKIFNVDR